MLIVPWCASMRRLTVGSPRPDPRALVVKNGVKIITFHALDRTHMKRIIDIQLATLMKRLEERKIHITLTDAAKEQLVREGYDPAYGARPLKRTLQRRVLDALAMRILEGEFVEGDTVTVDALADGLRVEKRAAVTA